MQKRNTLWMRYVNFEKLKRIIHIVDQNDGKLTVGALERKIRDSRIFLNRDGQPQVGHSTLYHYRKVLENFHLIILKNDAKYYVSSDAITKTFLSITRSSSGPLSEAAKECLRIKLVENDDCRENFFDVFMSKPNYDLQDLRSLGNPAKVEFLKNQKIQAKRSCKSKSRPLRITSGVGRDIELETYDKIQGIFWGLRLWSLNLNITNEIYTLEDNKRVIYPVSDKVNHTQLLTDFVNFGNNKRDSEWIEIYLPPFIEGICLAKRIAISDLHAFMISLVQHNESIVSFTPITMNAIMSTSPYAGMDETFLQYFPYINGVGHVSHLRLLKNKIGEIINGKLV